MDTSQNPPGISCLVHFGQVAKQHESSFLYDSREGRLFRHTPHFVVGNCEVRRMTEHLPHHICHITVITIDWSITDTVALGCCLMLNCRCRSMSCGWHRRDFIISIIQVRCVLVLSHNKTHVSLRTFLSHTLQRVLISRPASTAHLLYQPLASTSFASRSFSVAIPAGWNKLCKC